MGELIFLRAFGEICVCFAVIGAFPGFFLRDMMLLYPALLCAAGAAVGPWLEKRKLKYAALILPLASLLLADSVMEYLILLPAIAYTGLLVHRGAYDMEYYTAREQFLRVGAGLAVFAGIVFPLGYFEGMFGQYWDNYDFPTMLFYGLLFVFTQVFLLRQLRLGVDSRPEDRLRNDLEMVVVLALILGATAGIVALEELLRESITDVLVAIVSVAAFVPMVILEIIQFFLGGDGQAYLDTMEQLQTEPTFPGDMSVPDLEGVVQGPAGEEGFPWLAAVLVLLALCALAWYLLRTLSRGSGIRASGSAMETLEPEKPGTRERWISNRSKVRRIYRSYLKFVRRRGLRLQKDHTSQDVLRQAKGPADHGAQLRRIYVKARYDLLSPVTDQDVEVAKAAWKHIQASKPGDA